MVLFIVKNRFRPEIRDMVVSHLRSMIQIWPNPSGFLYKLWKGNCFTQVSVLRMISFSKPLVFLFLQVLVKYALYFKFQCYYNKVFKFKLLIQKL